MSAARLGRWVAVAPLVLLAWHTWWVCDDAYIAGRYARRLAAGDGFQFNLDGEPPVEGFSDLLWVLLGAVVEAAGGRSPEALAWVSLAAGVVGLWAAARAAERLAGTGPAIAATAVVAAFPPLAVWATSGLETMLWAAALVVLLDALLVGRAAVAVAAMVVVATVRAEGPLWGLTWLVIAWRGGGDVRAVRAAGLALGAMTAVLVAWRAWTFGALVPHTALVKVVPGGWGPLRGLAWLALAAGVWLTPLLVVGVARWRRAPEWPSLRPWLLAAGAVAGFGVAVGGDYLPFHRFLAPVWLLLTPALAYWLARLPAVAMPAAVAVLVTVGALPMLSIHLVPEAALYPLQRAVGTKDDAFRPDVITLKKERYRSPRRLVWARALAAVTEPGQSIVARGVGAIGYETELVVLDPYGLVSAEVVERSTPRPIAPGHDRRVSRGFFLGRAPDFLFAFALSGEDKSEVIDNLPHQWGLFEVLAPDEAVYVADLVPVPQPADAPYLLLVRRSDEGEDPEAARALFKDEVRAAGFRAPKLEPLDARRKEVALAKRRGADVAALLEMQRRE